MGGNGMENFGLVLALALALWLGRGGVGCEWAFFFFESCYCKAVAETPETAHFASYLSMSTPTCPG